MVSREAVLLAGEGIHRRPRRCDPITPKHISAVWLLLSEDERKRVSLAGVRSGLMVMDYVAARFEACKAALFGPRRIQLQGCSIRPVPNGTTGEP